MASSDDYDDSHLLTLPSGRILSYAIYGAPTASSTIFVHHGLPGSLLEARIFHAAAQNHGIRVVGIDRPGMGASSFQHNYRITDWPQDLLAVADHLGVERFVVLGISGGAPFALACLHLLPRARCVGGGIVAGVYPPSLGYAGMALETRALFVVGAWTPWLVEKMLERFLGGVARDAANPARLEEFLSATFQARPQADKDVWDGNVNGIRDVLLEDCRRAMGQGSRGAAWETYLVGNDWGFGLGDVCVGEGRLVLWHGRLDANWPVGMAEKACGLLGGAELRIGEGEGHVSIFARTAEEVVGVLGKMLVE